MLKRSEVNMNETWDLTSLFQTEADYEKSLIKTQTLAEQFVEKYQGKLVNATIIDTALSDYREFLEVIRLCGTYVSLNSSSDLNDPKNQERQAVFGNVSAKVSGLMSFFESELLAVDDHILLEVQSNSQEHAHYMQELLKDKQHYLHPEAERVLASLSGVLGFTTTLYNTIKLGDLQFDDFEVNGQTYPLSFVLFENQYDYALDHELRRKAHQAFSKQLKKYSKTAAMNYLNHVRHEKIMSQLRGFDSVFDYLLESQDVTREMYDRQIDVIMEKFAPVMRKYVSLLKDIHGLEKMTFADLKLVVDPHFEPEITIEESRDYLLRGLKPLGEDYLEMINRAYDERWVDFVQNEGKGTGAFCSSPYGAHPFVLISWTSRMREVFVMAHELGHAGHFYNSYQTNNILNGRPSLYFIESPSTMNELIMATQLFKETHDPRMQRWIYATLIARTYYHNFVTHILEAHFQRKVYQLVDEGKGFTAETLNQMMLDTYREFFGEAVEIGEEAQITWMRQIHYYKGLYPYTYSAGLTIATNVRERIMTEGQPAIDDWLAVLRAGGTKTPVELAAMAKVDITTEGPLIKTINTINFMVDEIIRLTKELEI